MAQIKFITVQGATTLSATPFYVGLVQHERTLTKKEAYDLLAERLGFKATAVRAVVMGLHEYVRENAERGNITYLDGVASIRNVCKGAFAGLNGPWVKGRNYLLVNAVEMDPFKTILAAITPTNKTEGAKPVINTVLDETTREYDVITGTHVFSIAGADLAPDETKADEYVALANDMGTETKCELDYSDLQNVKAHLAEALAAGEYTLKVYTRSGLGDGFGVACASRKVMVG